MGRRSDFPRIPRDAYPTPVKAVLPLLPFLAPATRFIEPCAGDGALSRHLEQHAHVCLSAFDIEPRNPSVVRRDAASGSVMASTGTEPDMLHLFDRRDL